MTTTSDNWAAQVKKERLRLVLSLEIGPCEVTHEMVDSILGEIGRKLRACVEPNPDPENHKDWMMLER